MDNDGGRRAGWTFLTNHARVLLAIAVDPKVRVRDIASTIGITERAAQSIVSDLEEAGYIQRNRVGRRNHYHIQPGVTFRHHTEADMPVQVLIDIFTHRDLPAGGASSSVLSITENRGEAR
ncbi:ArsR family transcriptional regulator [Nonomuraea mesophila]|uniref:ArsR family transcriptional regulator n=1 Tax=Nonomuraea mesophila TaxID=2530382 RepID=A0A4R5FMF3_9ACTN|nr:MarR family transcriptional regulator [Nonomuraea mesophila]TDE54069.1 ArsR family transcriptional regulator [Nonomuraea mesophila]